MDFHVSLSERMDLSGQIYRQLRRAIVDGQLRSGDALPPSRELARRLTVARATVTLAYERLAGEGFVVARVGAGTFVSERVASVAAGAPRPRTEGVLRARPVWDTVVLSHAFTSVAPYEFRTGVPDAALFPHEAWRRCVMRALRASGGSAAGLYGHPAGHRGLRAAIARHVAVARGVEAVAEDVAVTNGTQQALDVIARVLLSPGDIVAVEDPGYAPPRRLFATLGARVEGVPVDAQGLVVEALPRHARLVYVTPAHQYPLGVTMPLSRRLALLAWAERHNAAVIEDDYDSEFRFHGRPIEALQALDKAGRVIYVGSFSKTLLPSLRLGFIVAPPSLRDALCKARFLSDWHSSLPMQAALAHFMNDGAYARHLRKVGGVYRARHERIAATLSDDFARWFEVVPAAAGLHVTAIARSASVEQIAAVAQRASECGVEVQQLARFAVGTPRPGLVIGYGAIASARVAEGLQRLRRACAEILGE